MWDQGDHERRRERQSTHMRRTKWPRRQRCCLACLAPLTNGTLVCCLACDDLAWRIVPTLSGELWEPSSEPRRGCPERD